MVDLLKTYANMVCSSEENRPISTIWTYREPPTQVTNSGMVERGGKRLRLNPRTRACARICPAVSLIVGHSPLHHEPPLSTLSKPARLGFPAAE